jgi:hypothetical protein
LLTLTLQCKQHMCCCCTMVGFTTSENLLKPSTEAFMKVVTHELQHRTGLQDVDDHAEMVCWCLCVFNTHRLLQLPLQHL